MGCGALLSFVGARLLIRPTLNAFERSAAEHLAGRWVGDTLAQTVNLGNQLFPKCQAFARESAADFEKQSDLRQACLDKALSDERVFAVSPNVEPVTAETAAKWWRFPLLTQSTTDKFYTCYFAASAEGGTKGDPTSEPAGVITAYYPIGFSPMSHSFADVLESGGWWLVQEVADALPHPSSRDDLGQQTQHGKFRVNVVELSRDSDASGAFHSTVNRRFVTWIQETEADLHRFELAVSPLRFDAKQTGNLIASLKFDNQNLSDSDCI